MSLLATLRSGIHFAQLRLLLLTLLFSIVAVALNHLRLPLFFGIEFLFGAVIAVLAIVLLGARAAVVVGASAAAVTYFAWGHPYAWLVFSLEIAWLSYRWTQNRNVNLVLQDLIFWLFVGLPLIVFSYAYIIGSSWQTAALVGLKQMSNGVFNTLLASLVLLLMQLHQGIAQRLALAAVSLRQLLFHTLMALTLIAGSVPLILDARKQRVEYELNVANHLMFLAELLQQRLETALLEQRNISAELATLSAQLRDNDIAFAFFSNTGQVLYKAGPLQSVNLQTPEVPEPGFSIWLPAEVNLRLQRWRQSRYRYGKALTGAAEISLLLIEQGAAEVVKKLEQDSVRQLLLLVGFMLLSMAISSILSKVISAPLKQLAFASKRIKEDIASGRESVMPVSNVAEYRRLGKSLLEMSSDIADKFSLSKTLQSNLAAQVAERTAELQQSNSQLEAILAAASDFSIIATDEHGIINYFSRGAEKLLGYQAAELVNKCSPAIFHLPEEITERAAQLSVDLAQPIAGFKAFVVIAEQQGSESREWHYLCKDGRILLVQLTVTPIINADGVISGYLGIAKDISERHRNEKLKNEFISTVSHELRTPLTSIYGALAMVNSGTLATLPPKVTKLLQIAETNSQRLMALINDLLDFEKLVAGKLPLQLSVQELSCLVEEAIQAIRGYAEQYQISFQLKLTPQPLYIKVEAGRFIQILHNLLSNAIKFSNAGDTVTVRVVQQDETVLLEIIDSGVGIAYEFQERIFERFSQSDAATTRQQGGTGLGLAISKELTEQMGGSIGFDSCPGEGTTFWLRFPTQPANVAV